VAKLGQNGGAMMPDTSDSFGAGFLHGWLQGGPVAECLGLGSAEDIVRSRA
jgi:hypothetical protein